MNMIRIEITGDSQQEVDEAMRAFVRVADANTIPLDDLLAITKRRCNEAGFSFEMALVPADGKAIEPGPEPEPAPEPAPEPEPKRKRKATGPVLEASTTLLEADRAFVLDQLSERHADPKQRQKAKAFIDKVAKRNAGTRLSLLELGLFPAIRAELESEFGLGAASGNGHAA